MRGFARKIKNPSTYLRQGVNLITQPLIQKELKLPQDMDKVKLAKRSIALLSLPRHMQKSAHTVFGKYNSPSIREWGYKVAQTYTQIHGLEKPQDITKAKPFATSRQMLSQHTKFNKLYYKMPLAITAEDLAGIQSLPPSQVKPEPQLQYQVQHAVGYLYKRHPCSYGAIYRCLSELKGRIPDFQAERILDYGAGTGAGAWAAKQLFETKWINCVEPSKNMRFIGKKSTKIIPEVVWVQSLANLPNISQKEGIFDIVMCSYVLGQTENASTRNLIVQALWRRTKQAILFVEPGTPKGFRLINSVRNWMLMMDDIHILAPCPHQGECPLAKHPNSWCHFSQIVEKYPKDVIGHPARSKPNQNEKFSYLLVRRGKINRETYSDLQSESFQWSRMVRPPMKRTKHVILDLCKPGLLERKIISKGKHEKHVYKYARKSNWGDLWPFKQDIEIKKVDFENF